VRNYLSGCVFGLGLMLVLAQGTNMAQAQAIGEPVTPWSLISLEGTEIEFPRIAEGKPALLFFVPAACDECVELARELERLRAEFAFGELEVYVISQLDPINDAGLDSDSDLVLLSDESSVAAEYGLEGLPALLLIDQRGRLHLIESDASTMAQWTSKVRAALTQLVLPE